MLQYLTLNLDYFGTFNTVMDMCQAVYDYDDNKSITIYYDSEENVYEVHK